MILHQARVANTVVGGPNADTATRLLHDDGKDETVVDASGSGSSLDTVPNGSDLWAAVVGNAHPVARREHLVLVVVEHVLKGNPSALVRPAGTSAAVTEVQSVLVNTIANTISDVGVVVSGHRVVDSLSAGSLALVLGGSRSSRRLGGSGLSARRHEVTAVDLLVRVGVIRHRVSGAVRGRRRVRHSHGSAKEQRSDDSLVDHFD